MPKVWELYILERGLTRKARVQSATTMQKFFIVIVGSITVVSFVMLCLQSLGLTQENFLFSHIVISMLSAMGGYLFGNNTKISMLGG